MFSNGHKSLIYFCSLFIFPASYEVRNGEFSTDKIFMVGLPKLNQPFLYGSNGLGTFAEKNSGYNFK